MYKKQIWNDAKTVNVIASTCFIPKMTKVLTLALQFFAGKDAEKDSDNDSDSDVKINIITNWLTHNQQVIEYIH